MTTGPNCTFPSCPLSGEPDREIPCAAWCAEHRELPLQERIETFQAVVLAREERDRHAAP